jgi:hypothetical protein
MKLILQILYCWYMGGFKTKTGAEAWLKRQGIAENLNYHIGSQRRPRGE